MNKQGAPGPSRRALAASKGGPAWSMMESVGRLPQYDPQAEPFGVINLSGAENGLMKDWLERFTRENAHKICCEDVLSYGAISGTIGLRTSMANFFNRHFNPHSLVQPEDVLAANGVTSLIDLIAWTVCDPGDAIVYPAPNFYMLDVDLTLRANVVTIPVPCTQIHDPFEASFADTLITTLESAIDAAACRGIRCRALFICNPANPQGRYYSRETLMALHELCVRRGMHLVADEIYAMSQFASRTARPEREGFTSVLSLDSRLGAITESNIHCLYGMSKDFAMGGVRIAFLVSQNTVVLDAAKRATWFTWVTTFSSLLVERLMNEGRVEEYLDLYRRRLWEAYCTTKEALVKCMIPFDQAECGLFVYLDLSAWLTYFNDSGMEEKGPSREIQLCEYLVANGIFVNAGQFAGSDEPGHFRLVFTAHDTSIVILAIHRMRIALDLLETVDDHGSQFSLKNDERHSDRAQLEKNRLASGGHGSVATRKRFLARVMRWLNCEK